MRNENWAGHRVGKLTVIQKTTKKRKGSFLWECHCDCGNTIWLEAYKIRRGLVKSCGCARKGKNTKDLKGKKVGRLTVLERLPEKQGSCYVWKCRCDCGNVIMVPTNRLTGKHPTESCGCVRKGIDLTNQRFGKLTALHPTDKRKNGSVLWICQCDCGQVVEVAANQLMCGNTQSCGCLQKEKDGPGQYMNYIDSTCVEAIRSKAVRKDNTSGCPGVQKQKGKWIAQISFQKVKYYLGSFDTIEAAIRVRKQAETLLHDGFVRYFDEWKEKAKADPVWGKSHLLHVLVEGDSIENFELVLEGTETPRV